MDGHWKFLGEGGGGLKSQNSRSKVWSLTGISWGEKGCKRKTFYGGGGGRDFSGTAKAFDKGGPGGGQGRAGFKNN